MQLEASPLADNVEQIDPTQWVSRQPGVVGHSMARGGRAGLPFVVPNSHRIAHDERDVETTPVTFNRFPNLDWRVQLIAGFTAIPRNWLRISSWYRKAGWTNVVVPAEPGKVGGGLMVAGFPIRGPAPSQWSQAFNATAGAQPQYPGGPGQRVNAPLINPGTGALCQKKQSNQRSMAVKRKD